MDASRFSIEIEIRGQSSVIKGIERSISPLGWVSRDAANCGCNLITPPCDETVTGNHQILHTSSRRILCHPKTKPIQSIRRSPFGFADVSSSPGAMRRMDRALTSVLALLYPPAMYPDWSKTTEAKIRHPEELSVRERRKSIAIVSSSTTSDVKECEAKNKTRPKGPSQDSKPSEDASLDECYDSAAFDVDRSNRRYWLMRPWNAIASRWRRWHHEHEIRRSIAVLAELDDRLLRDIGIHHRSKIEQAVRYGRDR
jgi:uncharacterized protein YjiS (DUF1127 family)